MPTSAYPGRLIRAAAALAAFAIALASCSRDGDIPRSNTPPAPADLAALPPPAPQAVFPLQVRPRIPHLVDAGGRPFMLVADTAWSLLAQLTRDEIEAYLDDRRRRGYNAILVNVLESHYADHPPLNRAGQAPFLSPRSFGSIAEYLAKVDYDTPNPAYFELFDHLLERAAHHGILVMAVPSYLGYEGGEQGWWVAMERNGAAKMRLYGRFLGKRYRAHRNLMWVQGGDFNPPDRTLVDALAEAIREYDSGNLQTFHGGRGTGARDWAGSAAWLDVGNVYTAELTHEAAARERRLRPDHPFFLIEAYYEGDKPDPRLGRMQAYHALLSGASGQVSGHGKVWPFKAGWTAALDSVTSRSMTALQALFTSLRWWEFEPDVSNAVLRAGHGSGMELALAAKARDGSAAMVYSPSHRPLEVNLQALAGPRVRARWMDPADGRYIDAIDVPAPSASTLVLQTPAVNSAGTADWVLLLQSVH